MRIKWSFNRLLHNNKLMIIFSILAAIAIWASVVYGSGNIETRELTNVAVNLDLSDTFAGNAGLKIFDGAKLTVEATIRGSRATLTRVSNSHIKVTGNYSNINGSGWYDVKLNPTNISNLDFDVMIDKDTQRIFCDYEVPITMKVEADIRGVKMAPDTDLQLGSPTVEATGLENGVVKITGPRSVISRIASVVARVESEKPISSVTTFTTSIIGLDADGKEVDLKYCTFEGMTDNSVNVIVPVNVHRKINFTYKLLNVPTALQKNFVTISPPSIELVGTPELVDSYVSSIEDLGTFDLHHMNLSDAMRTIPLNVPSGVRILDNTKEVRVTFNMDEFSTKYVDLELSTKNTSVINKPDGKTVTIPQQTITNILLIGSRTSLARIKESNLRVEIDMGSEATIGSQQHMAIIRVVGFNDVWVYHGAEPSSGFSTYVTVSD